MAYLDRMGREGVRELVDNGEIATPDQLAERRARLEERRLREVPPSAPAIRESDVSNEAELRDALRLAIADRSAAEADHAKAVAALCRGRDAHSQAVAAVQAAGAEVDRIGADLAARFAEWAAGEGDEPEPTADSDPGAHARHVAAQSRAASAEQAVETLAATEAARKAMVTNANLRVQQAVHRVASLTAEVIARRVEAMRAEADTLAAGITHLGAHFGPNATAGAIYHTATARVVGGGIGAPRIIGQETAANRDMRWAWGEFVQALHTDPEAKLSLPVAGQ
ncbi:hypothetical protein ACQKQD_07635 [Methylobacterium sp. NPDC080182]|uniref:hypothetical protein n=1 Tax=Methylobacterium sp. NPDC080182 TaxID=3390590 RepID=UPI003D082577